MAGFAGVMSGLEFNSISNTIGFLAGLKAFTAAVVGGIGSIPGAMIGGIVIGLCEAFSLSYISTKYSDLIVFGILILTMLVRPTGIFGRRRCRRCDAWRKIGVDEWVAQSGERRDQGTGWRRVLGARRRPRRLVAAARRW